MSPAEQRWSFSGHDPRYQISSTRVCNRTIPSALHLPASQRAFVRKLKIALVERFPQARVHQLMNVQPHGFSRVSRQIENSGVHPDSILRTNLHAIPAIDANSEIDVKPNGVLFHVGIGMLARYDRNALRRA